MRFDPVCEFFFSVEIFFVLIRQSIMLSPIIEALYEWVLCHFNFTLLNARLHDELIFVIAF